MISSRFAKHTHSQQQSKAENLCKIAEVSFEHSCLWNARNILIIFFRTHLYIANRHVHTMSSINKQLTSEKLQFFMPTDMTIVEFLLLPLILFMHSQPLSLRRCAQYLFHIIFFCWCFCFSFIIFVPAFGEKCNATAGNNSLTTHLARSRQLATNTFLCTATNLRIFSSNNFSFAYFTLLHCLLFVVVGRSLCLPVGGDSFAAL